MNVWGIALVSLGITLSLCQGEDWSGKVVWKATTSPLEITVRVDGEYVYIEQVQPEKAAKLGSLYKAELKKRGDGVWAGTASGQYVFPVNGFARRTYKTCTVNDLIEITLLTPTRIEFRSFEEIQGPKFDVKHCTYGKGHGWVRYSFIPAEPPTSQ